MNIVTEPGNMKGVVCYIALIVGLGLILFSKLAYSEESEKTHVDEDTDVSDDEKQPHGSLIIYDKVRFEKDITEKYNFVMFSTRGCSYCRDMLPAWEELAELYDTVEAAILIAMVHCKKEIQLCLKQNVDEFPTIRLYRKAENNYFPYTGQRTFQALHRFVEDILFNATDTGMTPVNTTRSEMDSSVELKGSQYKHFIAQHLHFVMYYTTWCAHCKQLWSVWHDLADELAGGKDIFVSHLNCEKYQSLCHDANVRGFPSFKAFYNGKEISEVKGVQNLHDLEVFAKEILHQYKPSQEDVIGLDLESGLIKLTDKSFEGFIHDGFAFVNFCEPGKAECEKIQPEWKKLAKDLAEEDVQVGAIDCKHYHKTCSESEISAYPSFILYNNGVLLETFKGEMNATAIEALIKSYTAHEEL